MSAADAAFVRHKSRHAITWALLNLQRLADRPCATDCGRPLEGRTAIVVGAGYPLVRNVGHIADAQRRGAIIFSVNSSDPVLREHGIPADVLVARESVDNSAEIAASEARRVCLDISAHPEMWDAAGDRLAWFIPGYPRHFQIAQRIGVRPLFGGPAAFTSAVALAIEWGAARVVLVGAGLGMETINGELRPYHPDAPRGALRGRLDGDAVVFEGDDAADAVYERSGQKPQPKRVAFVWLPSHDNARWLPALHTLADEREWLETQAKRHGDRIELLNASEGGAGIVGWRNVRLADAPIHEGEPIDIRANSPVGAREQRLLVEEQRAQARTLGEMSEAILARTGPRLDTLAGLPGAVLGAPLAEGLAAWRLVDGPKGDPAERCRYTYEALRAASGDALQVLSGGER